MDYLFKNFKLKELWAEQGSNLRTRERTDLQSVAFNHSAICPTLSQWRDSNPRPADYKSAALANWATLAICLNFSLKMNFPNKHTYKGYFFGKAKVVQNV